MDLYFYLDRDSVLHRLDGLTKLALLAVNCAMGLMSLRLTPLLGVVALILLQAAMAQSLSNLRRVGGFLIIAGVFTILIWTLTGRGATPLIGWITKEGLAAGLAAALRINSFILAGAVFLSTTRNEDLIQALLRLRVPYPVCFAFSTALRLAPTFVGTGWAVRQAQKARGFDPDTGSILERFSKNIPMLVPTFLSTIRMTGNLAMSLESKGFGLQRRRTFLLESRLGLRDAAATVLMAAALTAVWLAR